MVFFKPYKELSDLHLINAICALNPLRSFLSLWNPSEYSQKVELQRFNI